MTREPGSPAQEERVYAVGDLLFSLCDLNMSISLVINKEKSFHWPVRPGMKAIRNNGSGGGGAEELLI